MKNQVGVMGLLALVLLSVSGCGIGIILFDEQNGGPPKRTGTPAVVFDVICADGFEASGGTTAMGSAAGTYSVGCTYQGKPMPWNVLGVFHAAPAAKNKWDVYRQKVSQKATGKGCPGVAIRTTAPTENQGGEAIGAFCVAI